MEWADALTWRSALACANAGTDRFVMERLHHIHEVQWAYLHLCRGEAIRPQPLEAFSALSGVRDWARRYHAELGRWLQTVDERALSAPLHVPWADELVRRFGSARPVALDDALVQVAMHSTYHRGQVATRVRQLAGEPGLSDYIVWLWRGRPEPDWEEDS